MKFRFKVRIICILYVAFLPHAPAVNLTPYQGKMVTLLRSYFGCYKPKYTVKKVVASLGA